MPAISLVVCLHGERELLKRLLAEATGCYDDLVVVHDGPDTDGVRAVAEAAGGRFFERPRAYQQEPHWPFAWQQAAHDWILRLDADEFPSPELKSWLKAFRAAGEPEAGISGFTCIWPLWNGRRALTRKWPDGRIFLFHRQRVRFFGMAEQTPIPDGRWEARELVLCHQPLRKSYGLANLFWRRQAYRWRERIARSLLGKPSDLPCWRWGDALWPVAWEQIRQHPFLTPARRLLRWPLANLRSQWRCERRFFPFATIDVPLHHACIGLKYWRLRRRQG